MVRLIVPASTIGGRHIWMRSPSGKVEPHNGVDGPTSCWLIAAAKVAIPSSLS